MDETGHPPPPPGAKASPRHWAYLSPGFFHQDRSGIVRDLQQAIWVARTADSCGFMRVSKVSRGGQSRTHTPRKAGKFTAQVAQSMETTSNSWMVERQDLMADDFYDYKLAIDPLTGNIVPGATAAVYTVDDTAHSTPLAITDLQGVPLPGNQITAGPTGIFPPFKVVSGAKRVIAVDVSSGVVTPMSSEIGKQGEPGEEGPPGPAGVPGLHTQNVTGAVTVPVEHEHTYELNATAAATVTLDGVAGCQAAIVWSGSAGTLEGTTTAAGQTYVAIRLTAGWKILLSGTSSTMSGTVTVVYASGAYPARPSSVPAGAVVYIGPVQPTDWLSNDRWVNNA